MNSWCGLKNKAQGTKLPMCVQIPALLKLKDTLQPQGWKVERVKVAQSCPTLCDPMDYTVYGILQARILEWVAFSHSRASFQPRDQTQVSRIADGFFTSCATREFYTAYVNIPLLDIYGLS